LPSIYGREGGREKGRKEGRKVERKEGNINSQFFPYHASLLHILLTKRKINCFVSMTKQKNL
jgi:hypothetical protein